MDWYQGWLRVYAAFPAIAPVLLVIDAPHGRFNSSNDSPGPNGSIGLKQKLKRIWESMNINGTLAWIIMELPAPINLLWNYHSVHPITAPTHFAPRILLAVFIIHYLNRAIISPVRTPSRSKSHIIVPLAAVGFNTLNGSLQGAYLGSLAKLSATSDVAISTWFWVGVAGTIAGLASNIWHDEVLLRLRTKPKPKPKQDGSTQSGGASNDSDVSSRYSVPYGGLYKFVSYPNYLSEWFEWICFAIAASSLSNSISTTSFLRTLKRSGPVFTRLGLGATGWYTPPWMFVAAEVGVMLPRAIRGHQWYHEKFGSKYPKERTAVIPFLL